MEDFEENLTKINYLLEKGDKESVIKAENEAKKLKIEVQNTECLEREVRIAEVEVILGVCETFLGKFDEALKNLESALRKHASLDVLNLDYWNRAYRMFTICKQGINVFPQASSMIKSFNKFRDNVSVGLGE